MPLSTIENITANATGLSERARKALNTFLVDLNTQLITLNSLLEQYNKIEDSDKQREHLSKIQQHINTIDDLQSDKQLAHCPAYFSKIHNTLFKELQREQQRLSLKNTQTPQAPATLAELISTMDPDKVNQMTAILSQAGKHLVGHELNQLYQPEEPGKEAFDAFFQTHRVRYLGGNNSQNFKITHMRTREAHVLKVENRLGYPRHAETQLRQNALASVLIPIHAERRAFYTEKKTGHSVSRMLQVMDYCPGNDLESYGHTITESRKKTITALKLHQDMAEILQRIQDDGCAFPDMKSSNWLVDASGQLRVADGKSFVYTQSNGEIDAKHIVYSVYMATPEMASKQAHFSANKMHTYILAKNLYQYLTACTDDAFFFTKDNKSMLKTDPSTFDFSYNIFKTGKGPALKELLSNALQEDPKQRLSLADMQAQLAMIRSDTPQLLTEEVNKLRLETVKVNFSIILKNITPNLELTTLLSNINTQAEQAKSILEIERIYHDLRPTDSTSTLQYLTQSIELLKQIKQHEVLMYNEPDKAMDTFMSDTMQRMNAITSPAELVTLHDSLMNIHKALENSNAIIEDIKTQINPKKYFMSSKGKRIMKALTQVPLTERQAIPEGETIHTKQLLDAMASSRILPAFMSSRTRLHNPASMFTSFKNKYQVTHTEVPQEEKQEKHKQNGHKPSPPKL